MVETIRRWPFLSIGTAFLLLFLAAFAVVMVVGTITFAPDRPELSVVRRASTMLERSRYILMAPATAAQWYEDRRCDGAGLGPSRCSYRTRHGLFALQLLSFFTFPLLGYALDRWLTPRLRGRAATVVPLVAAIVLVVCFGVYIVS